MYWAMTEEFTEIEKEILSGYFSSIEEDVFSITNLPEVTKAALFARYSRSPKSIRRLFLDEFYDNEMVSDQSRQGVARAQGLFSRVLADYGDDSVAQLGSIHFSFENISNIATKVLERPRLMSYLEQSTRYIPYDLLDSNGKFRYYTPPELQGDDPLAFSNAMDELFVEYAALSKEVMARLLQDGATSSEDSPLQRATLRAAALDATRGLLPASTKSNVGVYGSAQAFEALTLHLLAHPLMEIQRLGASLQRQLYSQIPSLVSRLDRNDRRDPWVKYLSDTRHISTKGEFKGWTNSDPLEDDDCLTGELGSRIRLISFDTDGERRVASGILFEMTQLSAAQIDRYLDSMTAIELDDLFEGYIGERLNRRHRPSRAFERSRYLFEIETDYGAFRDLQRHRMLNISWQTLTMDLGSYASSRLKTKEKVRYQKALEAPLELHARIDERYGSDISAYLVPMAYRVRFQIEANARELMHLIELRSQPQGHESYREVAQLLFKAISKVARHQRISSSMLHVDLSDGSLGRRDSIKREIDKAERSI